MQRSSQILNRQDTLRVTRIITIAMAIGISVFMLIMVFMIRPLKFEAPLLELGSKAVITLVALGSGLASILLSSLFAASTLRQGVQKLASERSHTTTTEQTSTESSLLQLFMNQHIVYLGLLEGSAFLNVIAYLIEGNPLCLVLALLLTGRIIASLPTGEKIETWIEQRQIEIADATKI